VVSGARSYKGDMSLMKLQAHDLASYRASCFLDPGFSEIGVGEGATEYPIRLPGSVIGSVEPVGP
jgi:hypothetical protein